MIVKNLSHRSSNTACDTMIVGVVFNEMIFIEACIPPVKTMIIGTHHIIGIILVPLCLDHRFDSIPTASPSCFGFLRRFQSCSQRLNLTSITLEPPFQVVGQLLHIEVARLGISQDVCSAVITRYDDKTAIIVCVEHIEGIKPPRYISTGRNHRLTLNKLLSGHKFLGLLQRLLTRHQLGVHSNCRHESQ